MARIAVGEVWGVGRRLAERLQAQGITTVLDLQRLDPGLARRRYSVNMERSVWELRGMPCLPLEPVTPPRQNILCSRSFGRPVTTLADLRQAVVTHASRAAEKLRRQDGWAQAVAVFILTSRFKLPYYGPSLKLPLVSPGNDSRPLVQAALQGLEQIYQPGWEYLKAGVMLLDIRPLAAGWTGDLLTDRDPGRSAALMRTLDTINARMGASTLRLASEGTSQDWAMHRSKLSGACTTQLGELPQAWAT